MFPNGVHKDKIVGLEMSPSKSVVVTLSEDKVVKMWEFNFVRGDFKCS